jgi:phosphatidylglycerophosphate synthase
MREHNIAVIDATRHGAHAPPERLVAGLTLVERCLRLASVAGCREAIVVAREEHRARIHAMIRATRADLLARVVVAPSATLSSVLRAIDPAVGQPRFHDPEGVGHTVLLMQSTTIYHRSTVADCVEARSGRVACCIVRGAERQVFDLCACDLASWRTLRRLAFERRIESVEDIFELLETEGVSEMRCLEAVDGWEVHIEGERDVARAADLLFEGCRKDADGLVARHINRHISLAISRRLAPFSILPNHVTIVTFALGFLAALCAAIGGYWGFALAGVVFQINSILDGVDGELARVRYEFSLLGEWLDTLSDDLSDVLFYGALSIGAWRTFGAPLPDVAPRWWLALGAVAVVGKLTSMALYYRWLVAHGRGDLLAFHWSFEDDVDDESTQETGGISRALHYLRYLTRKDFIVFLAMCLGLVGALPWLLFAAAPGHIVVTASVAVQMLSGDGSDDVAA